MPYMTETETETDLAEHTPSPACGTTHERGPLGGSHGTLPYKYAEPARLLTQWYRSRVKLFTPINGSNLKPNVESVQPRA